MCLFCFKQKTAYELCISDWSSDVCSSDLDGLWRTVSDIGKYRLTVADPTIGEVGFFAQVLENGVPILLATRLQVVNHTISQIEAVVSRTGLSEIRSTSSGARGGQHV